MSLDDFENRTPIAEGIWKRRVIGWSVSLCIIGPLAVLVLGFVGKLIFPGNS